jgi:hypothetical protein
MKYVYLVMSIVCFALCEITIGLKDKVQRARMQGWTPDLQPTGFYSY